MKKKVVVIIIKKSSGYFRVSFTLPDICSEILKPSLKYAEFSKNCYSRQKELEGTQKC